MRRCPSLGLALALAAPSPAAMARAAEDVRLAPDVVERLSDAELSEQRAGFSWRGMDISFGAEVRSYVSGALVMQTTISWTDAANSVQHLGSVAASPAATADAGVGALAGNGVTLTLGDKSVVFANQGRTAFIQRANGGVQNILVNTASNVDLRQEIDARLDIGNFAPFGSSVLGARLGSALSAMTGLALVRR